VLKALRGCRGWPRVVTLVLLLAFSAGLMHVHSAAPELGAASEVADMVLSPGDSHDGHDHEGGSDRHEQSATAHCTFCAVVAGKFFIPIHSSVIAIRQHAVQNGTTDHAVVATLTNDLFRPPIARSVG